MFEQTCISFSYETMTQKPFYVIPSQRQKKMSSPTDTMSSPTCFFDIIYSDSHLFQGMDIWHTKAHLLCLSVNKPGLL